MYLLSEWGSGYATAYDYYYYSDIWQEGGLPIYNMVMAGAITFISCLLFFLVLPEHGTPDQSAYAVEEQYGQICGGYCGPGMAAAKRRRQRW